MRRPRTGTSVALVTAAALQHLGRRRRRVGALGGGAIALAGTHVPIGLAAALTLVTIPLWLRIAR